MKKNKIVLIVVEVIILILVIFLINKIFDQSVHEKKIAVIIPNSGDAKWDSLIAGMKDAADANGIHMIICNTDEIKNADTEADLINEQQFNDIDAYIIWPAQGRNTKQMLIDECKNAPFVLITEDIYQEGQESISGFPVIKSDNKEMGQLLAEKMIENDSDGLNNKKIGFITNDVDTEQGINFKRGFIKALWNTNSDIAWTYRYNNTDDLSEIIKSKETVDYIVVSDSDILDELGEKSDDIHDISKIYGIGSSMKSISLLDYKKVDCLVIPDNYAIGYESVNELSNKLNNVLYDLESKNFKASVVSSGDLSSENIERLLCAYE